MADSEHTFATITKMRDTLSELCDKGLGDFPVQVLIVPDSTLQSLARDTGTAPSGKPALMIEYDNAVLIMSADRFGTGSPVMPSVRPQ